MYKNQLFGIAILVIVISSCQSDNTKKTKPDEPLFSLLSADETGIDFINEVVNQKKFNIFKYRNFYNGGGVAIGDINNDGLEDIYLTANMKPNKLYLNKGDFKFEDISNSAGIEGNKPWSTGVVIVDINQDGLLDIYVSNAGNLEGNNHDNDLFINNGDLTFTEKAKDYNLAETGFSTHASFFDYDKDGDLDAYILNNSNIPVSSLGYAYDREKRAKDWDVPDIFKGVGDMLLRNDDGHFKDVSVEAGIYGSLIGFGLGVYVSDLNGDLYPDIYVSNDFYERDYLYINNQDGTFTEDIKNWTSHLSLSAMGIDMADINNDGLNDIFITDMMPESDERTKSVMEFEGYSIYKLKQSRDFYQQYIQNTLQVNNGNQSFSEIAYFSGVAKTDWSWAGLIFDMDNDGYKDIFVTNGIIHDLTDIDFVDFFANDIIQKLALTGQKEEISSIIDKMPVVPLPNYAYKNNHDFTFENATEKWGLDIPGFSNGCAYADLDNDGDQDIVVNNVNMEAFVYRNNTDMVTDNKYLKLKFIGDEKNRFAIGTSVKLYYEDKIIFQELMPSRGFQSSVGYVMTIGLGAVNKIDSMRILWPDDKTQQLVDVGANQLLTFDHKNASEIYSPGKDEAEITLLEELDNKSFESHQENHFNDFEHEGLIASQLSQEGPALATADVNGDGRDDIFIGGAKGQPAMLYIHRGDGKLTVTKQNTFEVDARFEDTAAAFIDVDGDGDQDLVVGSGGNEHQDQVYISRLYLNNGAGQFKRDINELPFMKTNVSVIAPDDFDSDGDIDLFIGSRSVPGIYGIDPEHLFLVNNGDGTFSNGTEGIAYQIKSAGMVTDAVWADVDGDGINDLITVADWGVPIVFKNSGRRLSRMESSLDSLHGWWNTIETSDLDRDGDMDLIIGNKGSNIPYKPSMNNPMRLYINDFDNNGAIEQITTTNYDNGDYPIHMRKELTTQIASLRKENLMASDYAKKTIDQLFPNEVMQNTIVKSVNIAETIVAVNEGEGIFSIIKLPNRVQFSCVNSITCADIDKDGNMDLIMAGNNFEFKPQYSRLDANYGSVLLGDGKMSFEWQAYSKSGFFLRDEIKHLAIFSDNDGKEYFIAAINDSNPKIFKFNQ
jgi:hypothetical protein